MDEIHVKKTPLNDFRFALILLIFSGAAALGNQLLWTRRMIDLLGATAESNARVFGCFFLGLALGSAFASKWVRRCARPWRSLAALEAGTAILSLPALLLPVWSGWIWPAVGSERLQSWQGPMIKLGLSIAFVFPPAFLIGIVLPLATAIVLERGSKLSKQGIWLYAIYTLGGALGLILVVGLSLPSLGASGSMKLMLLINLALAAACLQRDRGELVTGSSNLEAAPIQERKSHGHGQAFALAVSFFSGFGVLALEVLTLQMYLLVAPLCWYPTATILFCVILCLAISSGLTPFFAKRIGNPPWAIAICLVVASFAIASIPLLFMDLPAPMGVYGSGGNIPEFLLGMVSFTLISLGPAMLCAGVVFPLATIWSSRIGNDSDGAKLPRLLAVNGLGGILGAEFSFRILLPSFGEHVSIGLIGLAYGLVGLALAIIAKPTTKFGLWTLVGTLVLSCWIVSSKLTQLPLFWGDWGNDCRLLDIRSGREGCLAVVESSGLGRAVIFSNQYLLGGTASKPAMERETHLPLLLHPRPEKIAFIGLGTGITSGGALLHRSVNTITSIEHSSLVVRAAKLFFNDFNHGITTNSATKILIEDARTFLSASPDGFDVIVGDLFTPWRPGEASLCSLEQFQSARNALRSGGVFCQWLPMHQLTSQQFYLIVNTFNRVFGTTYLFRNHFMTQSIPLALVGFKEAALNWETVAKRCDLEREGKLKDPVSRHVEGLAMLYLGQLMPGNQTRNEVNTLGNLRVELSASRQLIVGNPNDYLSGSNPDWWRFMEQKLSNLQSDATMPQALKALPSVGFLLSRWEEAMIHRDPSADSIHRQIQSIFPPKISSDTGSDGSLWPGHVLPFDSPTNKLN